MPFTSLRDRPRTGPDTGQQTAALAVLERMAEQQARMAVTQVATAIRVPQLTVLIPAHNEAATIGQAIGSLRSQGVPALSITVVCDNCTDDTAAIAGALGVRVMATSGNRARKAGALNQALSRILPGLGGDDLLLAMDADSVLLPGWVEAGTRVLAADRRVGAVCGSFFGEAGAGLTGQIQRNEYYRYARIIQRRFQVPVLSGTGTLFRVRALREIGRERGSRLPGSAGEFYNPVSITEDDEITLAIKTLGWKCLCPPACETVTEMMPTWRALWTQRMRWQKGALSDLASYGVTPVTRPYWLRQGIRYFGFAVSFASMAVILGAVAAHPGISVPWTAGVLSVTAAERTWTVRRGGWRAMLLAAVIVPESAYALFQGWLFFHAAAACIRHREVAWGHVAKKPLP